MHGLIKNLIVLNKPRRFHLSLPDTEVISAKSYLIDECYSKMRYARVYNLCQSYRYQGIGYYVSLLAEARGHRSFPNITTIQDLKSQSIIKIISSELDELIQNSLKSINSRMFYLNVYFGKSYDKQYDSLSKQLYNLFQAPLFYVVFEKNPEQSKWILQNIFPLPIHQIPEPHQVFLQEVAEQYFLKKRIRNTSSNTKFIYDLAILVSQTERAPPSNSKALEQFMEASEKLGMRAKFINKNDFSRIPEFDALFIRETTAVNHHTYRFARRALAENLVVLDDPTSIVRCANKVYMAEVLRKAHISIPKTIIAHKKNGSELISQLGLPCVLKQPDGSFSNGVIKAHNRLELEEEMERLLNQSDLIIAQEYTPTEFDWRIGVLDKQPLFACKYFMAENHWQIHNWHGGRMQDGNHECLPLDQVPEKVLKLAVRAASLIGDGLYGVDLKQHKDKVVVLEVNDNPSIDMGVEDILLKEQLYLRIMEYFKARIKIKKQN